MLRVDSYRLLERAAAGSRHRLRRDRHRVAARLRPVFAELEEHLFDPRLRVGRLKQVCGIRDSSLAAQFRAAFGRSTREYIRDRRFETASRLLAESDLKIWQIAELVGFTSLAAFHRAFTGWAGEGPKRYRERGAARSGGGRSGPPPGAEGRFSDPEWLRRAVAGELPAAEAGELIERLWRLYPALRP